MEPRHKADIKTFNLTVHHPEHVSLRVLFLEVKYDLL